jgi:hypothetical protein
MCCLISDEVWNQINYLEEWIGGRINQNLLPKSSITAVRSFDQIAIININSDGAIQLSLCIFWDGNN